MLGLKLPTDPRWINVAKQNLKEILTDHAYCEKKQRVLLFHSLLDFLEIQNWFPQ